MFHFLWCCTNVIVSMWWVHCASVCIREIHLSAYSMTKVMTSFNFFGTLADCSIVFYALVSLHPISPLPTTYFPCLIAFLILRQLTSSNGCLLCLVMMSVREDSKMNWRPVQS